MYRLGRMARRTNAYNKTMNRTALINYIIKTYGLKKYLEFGISADAQNWKAIEAPFKYSFDIEHNPEAMQIVSSDQFFSQLNHDFDFIFIDGDHHADQAYKDILNALEHLSVEGFILCHDTCPHEEFLQRIPREQEAWTGDVWKAILRLRKTSNVYVQTLNADFGLTIVKKNKFLPLYDKEFDETWENYLLHRNDFMNIKSEQEFAAGLN